MTLQPGQMLSHYRLVEQIGEGGMGVVWKAKDTILDREVAIKVLPDAFAKDPDRLARFEREAKLLAALNHSNIAAIHGLEKANGQPFLVLELVDGETLTARLSRGAMPPRDALSMALQIAKALEAAHEKEIIHRDLKPANVKITSEGKVKVLDFGLAKVLESTSEDDACESSQAPTLTQISTQGALLGTPGYMSPEQVEGLPADKRSDIWSFGCLLYESLTGTAAFGGKTAGNRIAATLAKKPDFTALPSGTPLEIKHLLRRCLRRERARRIHSIADARIEIEDVLGDGTQESSTHVEENPGVQPLSPTERTFRLTAQLCRKLDRTTLDPRVIGDDMHYIDNERSSDVLVFYLPGLGLDHRIFEETLALSPFRGLALTFYGCEPVSRHRIVMAMADQLVVLRQFLANTIEHLAPEIVILAGFSLGADAAFRLLSETELKPGQVDGILSLSCNLSLDTCVFSARLAEVASATTEEMLPVLRAMGSSVTTLDEWIQVHRYLVELVSKFRLDFGVLRSAAKAVVEPFKEPTRQPFAKWYRSATEQGTAVRCVFTDTEIEQNELRRIKLDHLDSCILGTSFSDDDLFTETGKNHFDLLDTQIIRTHLDWLVHRIRQKQRG